MTSSYFYRGGERVPVSVLESARVSEETGERMASAGAGWIARPLERGLSLLIREEAVSERSAPAGGDSLEALTSRLIRYEEEKAGERGRVAAAARAPSLEGTYPVVLEESGRALLFSSGEVIVQLPEGRSRRWLEELIGRRGWSVSRSLPYLAGGFVLKTSSSGDPLAFANWLAEEQGFPLAHPNFLEEVPDRSRIDAGAEPSAGGGASSLEPPEAAELFGRQWHLRNEGQDFALAGIDIDAAGAWAITRGSPQITVAVIDSGVALAHEVFAAEGKLTEGYNFADDSSDPRPGLSSHGTACAALVGAGWGDGRVLGVAPDCRIMPIRRSPLGNHLALADAFAWAVDHGADVINCSFGVDGRPWVLPDVVRQALTYAVEQGRDGAGCPVFWAAGNGNEEISDDEWATAETVIAVAASTDQGTRAPYSDFGPEVDLSAPSSGGNNGIVTADNDGYTQRFGGTSAAAPIAAGVAALVLSVAPHMRWHEVRDLLARSARKIDLDSGGYDERGHSLLYGFGQVDARQALLRIDSLLEASRALGVESELPRLEIYLEHLRRRRAGRALATFLGQRRFGVLRILTEEPELRETAGRLLRLAAELGSKLADGATISIEEEALEDALLLLGRLRTISPLDASATSTENPFDHDNEKEESMSTGTQEFDQALARLAETLGSGERDASGAILPPPPRGNKKSRERLDRKGRVARQHLYLSGMPMIGDGISQDLELSVPQLVKLLKSLRHRPALRRRLIQQAKSGLPQIQQAGDGELEDRVSALSQVVASDMAGGERIAPALALGLVMAGYTVVKYWGR